ncbi:MAG: hypothetical protein WBE20_10630 [Candidatus Acidiferrales bacterium]
MTQSNDTKKVVARWGGWFLAAALLGVAGYYLVQPLSIRYIAHAQVTVAPFTLQQQFFSQYDQNPNGQLDLKLTVARTSDGATVKVNENIAPNGSPGGRVRVIDLPDGQEFVVYDEVSAVVRSPQPPDWVVAMRKQAIINPPSNCVEQGDTLRGYDQLQGHPVAIVELPRSPSGIRYTAWESPGLGCQMLQSLSEALQPDGSYKTVGRTTLVTITSGEPDASLLEVSTNYQTLMPSEALRKEVAHLGGPWTDKLDRIAKQQDANYLEHLKGQWGPPPRKNIF